MEFIIKSIVIMCAILLLAAYSSGNPLPCSPRPPATDSTCHKWQLNTTSEIESVTQVSNGVTVFNVITPNQGLLNELVFVMHVFQDFCNGYNNNIIL